MQRWHQRINAENNSERAALFRPYDPRCRSGRKELITSIVAGKSFSLAANVQGQMFAWGKGWTGQLGLGVTKDLRVRGFVTRCGRAKLLLPRLLWLLLQLPSYGSALDS